MNNVIIFGAGNIGSTLIKRLGQENANIKCIVRSDGVFDISQNKIAEQKDWRDFIDEIDLAFICIPTKGKGNIALEYELAFLEKGKPVITCEKASIANHWDKLKEYKNIFKYTASVGGGTMMLKEISKYKSENISEINAVVNGTLNYIGDELKSGKAKEQIVKEIFENKFSEPGANTFDEIINIEIKDAIYKTIIISNHTDIFDRTITENDIEKVGFKEGKRCVVKITKDKIQTGFTEDNNSNWLPTGVNNVMYINGEKKAYGPGAGAQATVSAMIDDYLDLTE